MEDRVFGLLGRTLGHSYSVPIHRALGCAGYRLIEREPEALPDFFETTAIGGLNVTIPYKREVMRFCGFLSPEAQAIGSVNTLVRRDGVLCGYNTDLCGFTLLARSAGISFAGEKVVIFGSGGASLMVQEAARRGGAAEIAVISRSGPDNYDNLSRHADAGVVVNATPVGMSPAVGKAPADLTQFPHCHGVLDLIYNPARTALLLQAEALGIPCANGLLMLVAQAKAAQELFTGRAIPDSEIPRISRMLAQQMQNIVLIGMPGSGKSTVGALLAALAGRPLLDTDAMVERAARCTIPEIFARQGEAEFRRLEHAAIAKAGAASGSVIVTGGGAVKDAANAPLLRHNGRVYHLNRAVSALPREGRPLSQGADLQAMYRQRLPLYRAFLDVEIDNTGAAEDTAAAIWRDFLETAGD